MSTTLRGPIPGVSTTIVLPEPRDGNTVTPGLQIVRKPMLEGRAYVYGRDAGADLCSYTFLITEVTFRALKTFILANLGKQVELQLACGEKWVGYFATNPITGTRVARTSGRGAVTVNIQIAGVHTNATYDDCGEPGTPGN